MNEPLCRALIAAGLSEEDVAARLEVDPKTVRRWLEGRPPYRRHRWALAMLLGVDDADLWPGLRGDRGRPDEVVAVYPHRDEVPGEVWVRLFGSARREIGILAGDSMFLAEVPGVIEVLGERAGAGVRVRICLGDPRESHADREALGGEGGTDRDGAPAGGGGALSLYGPLRTSGDVQIRLHHGDLYGDLCFADDQLLVVQPAYGIPLGRCPVLRLDRCDDSDLFATYLASLERSWSRSRAT